MSLRFPPFLFALLPAFHVNLGLHGAGLSVGPRDLGVNRRGMYTSAAIPGAGIYAVHHIRRSSGEHPKVAGNRLVHRPVSSL
jgi:hypothetical protein